MLPRPIRTPPVAHPRLVRLVLTAAWTALAVLLFVRCSDAPRDERADSETAASRSTLTSVFSGAPDQLPVMANPQPPFRYPATLYGQRVQGNVTLRLFVDSTGRVLPDSTRVEETSGHAVLDSAAVTGARDLHFNPARRRGSPIAVSLLYPVYFRHPEAQPLPGDTVLNRRGP